MNVKAREHLLSVILALVCLLASSCQAVGAPPDLVNGNIMQLQPLTTCKGMLTAINGSNFTIRMVKDGALLLGWFQNPGCGFTCMQYSAGDPVGMWRWLTGGKGQLVTPQDFAGVRAALSEAGWTEVGPAAIPATIATQVKAWLVELSGRQFTILVVPASVLEGAPDGVIGEWR